VDGVGALAPRTKPATCRRQYMQEITQIDMGLLFKELLDGVFVCRKSGELLYVNPAFGRILGLPEEKVASKRMGKDIVDRELEWQALTSLMEQGSPIMDYEINVRKADGTRAVMAISATMYRDSRGMPVAIAGVMRDISTRKGVENDLREKAFRTDIVNRIAKSAGTSKDIQDVVCHLVEDLRKLVPFEQLSLGVTEEKGRHVEVIAPDPEARSKARSVGKVPFEGSLVEKLKYGKRAIVVEKDASRKLFSEFAVLDNSNMSSVLAVPLKSRGRTIGSLNIAHSRTGEYDWERAEALQTVADHLAGMIDNIVLLKSLESKIGLHEILLASGIELQKAITTVQIYASIASHMKEVVPYSDLSFYLVDWQNRLVYPVYAVGTFTEEIMSDEAGGFEEGIVGYVAKTGRAEFVDDVDSDPRGEDIPGTPAEHNAMLAIPLAGSDGVLGVLELYRERGQVFSMSDLEAGLLFAQQASIALANAQLVAKLQDAKKEIELLNDLMFHDINNYNFATLNYVEGVVRTKVLPKEHEVKLEKALHLIRQNSELIDSVKKLTKIGIMSQDDFEPVNLKDVIVKVTSGMANASPNKTVSFDLKLPEADAFVMANTLIDELFVNIVSNAIKYDPHDDVEIDIGCTRVLEEGHAYWKVTIADRGQGIPDDKKDLLFQKYVRLKLGSEVSGTGLGLSIVRALADRFNGRVWMEDRVPGRNELGARFCVELPAAKYERQ
jgi:PAS domain S-box-containing protein